MAEAAINKSDYEQKYYEISELYDLAEELTDTVQSEFCANPEEQLAIVAPLIEQVGDAADVLCEEYIQLLEGKGKRFGGSKSRVEGALRRIYVAIDEYGRRVKQAAQETGHNIVNIADPIVKKLKRHMETVIGNFMELVELSLDRIMQKSEIEELKQRQAKIAMMLHQLGQGA